MKKILIIGSNGMAGHIIYHYFKGNTEFEVVDIARRDLDHKVCYCMDVMDFNALNVVLETELPSVVINCVGVLNKDAEDHPDKAILLNSYLPHFLARAGNEKKFKLIHISTDCVFKGTKGGYTEHSEKDGIGFYAETKALGEVNYGKHLTLRTSIVGPELKEDGIGLFHWFMHQKGKVKGYTSAFWTGITTLELAKAINVAIMQDTMGLHHLVNGEKISKFDLISLFKRIFNRDETIIEPNDAYIVDKSLIKTKNDFKYIVPSYDKMIEELRGWIDLHASLYGHNY